jgi:hypothetical protein
MDYKILNKSPFDTDDSYITIHKKIKKIIDSTNEDKLEDAILKLLTDDPVKNHITGQVLDDLGYIELSKTFYNKAKEQGYNIGQGELNYANTITEAQDYANLASIYELHMGVKPENDPNLQENIHKFIESLGVEYDKEEIENELKKFHSVYFDNDMTRQKVVENALKQYDVELLYKDGTVANITIEGTIDEIKDKYVSGKKYNLGTPDGVELELDHIKIWDNGKLVKESSVHIVDSNHIQKFMYKNEFIDIYNYKYEKPEYDITALKYIINEDPFLTYTYNELMEGDWQKDFDMMFNNYIKNDEDFLKKLKTKEKYMMSLNENLVADSLIKSQIVDLLNSQELNFDAPVLNKIVLEIENIIETLKVSLKTEISTSDANTKFEFAEKISSLSSFELLNKFSRLKYKDINEITTKDIIETFNINEELSTIIVNMLNDVYNTINSPITYSSYADTVIFYITCVLLLKSI